MLVTSESNRRNRNHALGAGAIVAAASVIAGWLYPPLCTAVVLAPLVYFSIRRRTVRRLRVMAEAFPASWEKALRMHVAYYRALPTDGQERFRQMVKVFLDEIRITGINTDIDDTVRVLVAASAVIPVFGFHDWEYRHLGEVLVYPDAFDEQYQTAGKRDRDTVGMVGLKQLRGVMILSKPSLLAGFDKRSTSDNVGIHEFAHLVEQQESESGLPPEVPWQAVRHWVEYVGRELAHPAENHAYIRDYAYTNEHEFFAVLAEYFFKSPELLKEKDPTLYGMLRDIFHQDTASLPKLALPRRARYGRNDPCPCGSGKKYKHCCLRKDGMTGPPGEVT